ncbi:MAG: CDP-diacylglycerol--serine O-phosphatidyltransferase [Candidatus Zixiibacteriota bacterium]
MTNFRGIFPGIFTVGNLFCGFLAILSAFDGQVMNSCRFILLGFFLDGLDGFVARVSNSVSRFGMELDSLSDLLTFGVAPAVLLYNVQLKALGNWGWMVAFVFVMCGAFRLARFNLSARTSPRGTFEGLPIPAAASLLVSYTLFCLDVWGEFRLLRFLIVMIIVTSGLMVSSIAYENKPTSWRDPRDRIKFVFIAVAIVGAVIDLSKTLFPFVLIYVLSGIVREGVHLYQSGRRYARNIRANNR